MTSPSLKMSLTCTAKTVTMSCEASKVCYKVHRNCRIFNVFFLLGFIFAIETMFAVVVVQGKGIIELEDIPDGQLVGRFNTNRAHRVAKVDDANFVVLWSNASNFLFGKIFNKKNGSTIHSSFAIEPLSDYYYNIGRIIDATNLGEGKFSVYFQADQHPALRVNTFYFNGSHLNIIGRSSTGINTLAGLSNLGIARRSPGYIYVYKFDHNAYEKIYYVLEDQSITAIDGRNDYVSHYYPRKYGPVDVSVCPGQERGLITWSSWESTSGSPTHIFAQYIAGNYVSSVFQVSTTLASGNDFCRTTCLKNLNNPSINEVFIAVWHSRESGVNKIRGQFWDYFYPHIKVGSEFVLCEPYCKYPEIASFNDGKFVLIWLNDRSVHPHYIWELYVQVFHQNGTKYGSKFMVTNQEIYNSLHVANTSYYDVPGHSVTTIDNSKFVVAWSEYKESGESFLRGNILSTVPVFLVNSMNILENETVILSSLNLKADKSPCTGEIDNEIYNFTVKNVNHGHFEFLNVPGVPIFSFSDMDISYGVVRFIHDGSEFPPSYDVSVYDGGFESNFESAEIHFTNVNDLPYLVKNHMILNKGQKLRLSNSSIQALDDETNDSNLIFFVSKVEHGKFLLNSDPDSAIFKFTQGQVLDGLIYFEHNGNSQSPSYELVVGDGEANSSASLSVIDFAPLLSEYREEFRINFEVIGDQKSSTFIMAPSQKYVVSWDSPNSSATDKSSIVYFGIYSCVSNLTAFGVVSHTDANATQPKLVHFWDNFTVVWSSKKLAENARITGKTFQFNGSNLNSEFFISDSTDGNHIQPFVLRLSNQTFLVIWTSLDVNLSKADVYGRVFWSDGKAVTGAFVINSNRSSNSSNPSASLFDNNKILIAWQEVNETKILVKSKIFNINGINETDEFIVESFKFVSFEDLEPFSVLSIFPESVLLVLHMFSEVSQSYEVEGITVHIDGSTHRQFIINEGNYDHMSPALSTVGDSYFVVAWKYKTPKFNNYSHIFAQMFHNNGSRIGSKISVTTYEHGNQINPNVESYSKGPILFSWESHNQDGSGLGVYGKMLPLIPVLLKNTLGVKYSQFIQISTKMLNGVHGAGNEENSLVFFILDAKHGHFESLNHPGTPISNFSKLQIQNDKIVFVLQNFDLEPSYKVSISDGVFETAPEPAIVVFYVPKITKNKLSINESQSIILKTSDLTAVDDKASPSELIYSVVFLVHGCFATIIDQNTCITNFSQQQIGNSEIVFTHDGSESSPAYNLSVSDGVYTSWESAVSVTFLANMNDAPVMTKNTLAINEGATVVLTEENIACFDSDNGDTELIFFASNVQNCKFTKVSDESNTAIFSFTQKEIKSQEILIQHTGGTYPPFFALVVTDGILGSPQLNAIVNFNQKPVIVTNELSIHEGETVILESTHFSSIDAETDSLDLLITIESVEHGFFALVSDPTIPVMSFPQSKLLNSEVIFVHDGGESAPSYSISVSDGNISCSTSSAIVTFYFVNDLPVVMANNLELSQGDSVELSQNNMAAMDVDNINSSLVFIINNVSNGHFALGSKIGIEISNFTQEQVINNMIVFIHDNSAAPPSYQLTVSDLIGISNTSIPSIKFNLKPILVFLNLSISEGETILLSPGNFYAFDEDSDPESLIFLVVNVSNGYFSKNLSEMISNFTLDDLSNKSIYFVHNGGAKAPMFAISISDRVTLSEVYIINVHFNSKPRIVSNQLLISENETVTLKIEHLNAVDLETPSERLIFNVIPSSVKHGYFEHTSQRNIQIYSFSQKMIIDSSILFLHDGDEEPPEYKISVSDGSLSSEISKANVTFTNVNDKPFFVNFSIKVNESETVQLSTESIFCLDPETPPGDIYIFVEDIQNGYFVRYDNKSKHLRSFIQNEIIDGNILFVHNGSEEAPSVKLYSSDGNITSDIIDVIIAFQNNFNDIPIIVSNFLSINQGEIVTLTAGNLKATDPDNEESNLLFILSKIERCKFENKNSVGISIETFTQLELLSGYIRLIHDGSVFPPYFEARVRDNYNATSNSSSVFVVFNSEPVLLNNDISVDEGGYVILSSLDLNITDESEPEGLYFSVKVVEYGQFESINQLHIPITVFTQKEIDDGLIAFRHNGSELRPFCVIEFSDGAITKNESLNFYFGNRNDDPVLSNLHVDLSQGETIILSSSNFELSDPDNQTNELRYFVINTQYCHFAIKEKENLNSLTTTNFSQDQINAGNVLLVHDGSLLAPVIEIIFSDGIINSSVKYVSINFNFKPIIRLNYIKVSQGQSVVLTTENVKVEDSDNSDSELILSIYEVQNGKFYLKANPNMGIEMFSQEMVKNEQVLFQHNGSSEAPNWKLVADDGKTSTMPEYPHVIFNSKPILLTNSISIDEGNSLIINTTIFFAIDKESDDASIIFHIYSLTHGTFVLISNPSVPVTNFSQLQVSQGKVIFQHDGEEIGPGFKVSVSDSEVETEPVEYKVNFRNNVNDPPVVINHNIVLNEGETIIITTDNIKAEDPDITDEIVTLSFRVNDINNGKFSFISNPEIKIFEFNELDIALKKVLFTHDGSEAAPSFKISAFDGKMYSSPISAVVTFSNNKNDPPIVTSNILEIFRGGKVVITSDYLNAEDPDNGPSELIFRMSEIQHGQFELFNHPGVVIEQFKKSDILDLNVVFYHDGSSHAPSFKLSVSDGEFSTAPKAARVTLHSSAESESEELLMDYILYIFFSISVPLLVYFIKNWWNKRVASKKAAESDDFAEKLRKKLKFYKAKAGINEHISKKYLNLVGEFSVKLNERGCFYSALDDDGRFPETLADEILRRINLLPKKEMTVHQLQGILLQDDFIDFAEEIFVKQKEEEEQKEIEPTLREKGTENGAIELTGSDFSVPKSREPRLDQIESIKLESTTALIESAYGRKSDDQDTNETVPLGKKIGEHTSSFENFE